MTRILFINWLFFSTLLYFISLFTSGRFFQLVTDPSKIPYDIINSLFSVFVLGFIFAFLSIKFIFKKTVFKNHYFSEKLIYKRLLANVIDFIILYLCLFIFTVPVIIIYFSKIINTYTTLIFIALIITCVPVLYFSFCWKKGGTIGYKIFKLSLIFHKNNHILRAILKTLILPFHIFGMILIFLSMLSSKGKTNLLDSIFHSEVE